LGNKAKYIAIVGINVDIYMMCDIILRKKANYIASVGISCGDAYDVGMMRIYVHVERIICTSIYSIL
jgi:hypothetical protein